MKTKYIVFGTQQRIALATLSNGPFSLFLGEKLINQAQHKYLGVLIDTNLNFKQHMDKLLVKISKRIGVAWSSIGKIERDRLDRAQRTAANIVLKTKDLFRR